MSQQLVSHSTAPKGAPKPATKSRAPWIAVGVIVAIAIIVAICIVSLSGSGEPRLSESTDVLIRFLTSKKFEELPFEKQRQFYKVFDDRDKQIDQAFKARQMTEAQYRAALEAAWLGKHLNRVEKYFGLPPGQARTAYIDGLLAKKNKKSGKNDHENVEADESVAESKVDQWPAPIRDQWTQFHTAYKKEKKSRESATTRPQ